jgi:hypothetical protein
VVDHWRPRCSCGHVFGEDEQKPSGAPARHQVAELPPLAIEISEHRLQRVCCPGCGRTADTFVKRNRSHLLRLTPDRQAQAEEKLPLNQLKLP